MRFRLAGKLPSAAKWCGDLQDSLARREKQCRLTTAEFLETRENSGPSAPPAQPGWLRDYQELQDWHKLLAEYEQALHSLKAP